jgi:hypothetical protein
MYCLDIGGLVRAYASESIARIFGGVHVQNVNSFSYATVVDSAWVLELVTIWKHDEADPSTSQQHPLHIKYQLHSLWASN